MQLIPFAVLFLAAETRFAAAGPRRSPSSFLHNNAALTTAISKQPAQMTAQIQPMAALQVSEDDQDCTPKEVTASMNRIFSDRDAKEGDCQWLCCNQGREAWCVHHEFSSENDGTCKLYDCAQLASPNLCMNEETEPADLGEHLSANSVQECLPTEATENMNDLYGRDATEDDCHWLCNHHGKETWCVHYEYSSEARGTCKLYTCLPQASNVRLSETTVLTKLDEAPPGIPECKDNEAAIEDWQLKTCAEHLAAGNCITERVKGVCDATCGRCPEIESEGAPVLDANKDGVITTEEFAAASAEEVAAAGKNASSVFNAVALTPLWMSEEQLLKTYGKAKAKDMVERGFISARESPGDHDETQYALNWVDEDIFRQIYDEAEIARLFARRMTKSRPDPGNPERMQYLVEGSQWSPSNRWASPQSLP